MKNKKFNAVMPLNSTGYGVASIGYLNQLCLANPDIAIVPIGNISNQGEIAPQVMDCIKNNKPDFHAPTFCFWHLFDIPNQLSRFTGHKVGFTTFEVNSFNQKEQDAINSLDHIGTASYWGSSVLETYVSSDKIFIAPHAFKSTNSQVLPKIPLKENHRDIWNNILAPAVLPKDCLILSTAGKWESRKGYPELIEACLMYEKPIALIAFCYNPFILDNFPYGYINSKFMYSYYTNSGLKLYKKNNLYFVMMPPTSTRTELHSALSKADFFISPSKGEGWNLPLFEMMSLGMPCINSVITAMAQYCNNSSCIPVLISSPSLVQAKDDQFFDGSSQWYNITPHEILISIRNAQYMKDSSNSNSSEYMREGAIDLTKQFSWQKSAEIIQSLMNQF